MGHSNLKTLRRVSCFLCACLFGRFTLRLLSLASLAATCIGFASLRLPEPALTLTASLCLSRRSLSLSSQLLEDEVMKNKESDEIYIAGVTDDGTQIFNELGAAGPNRPMGGFASLLENAAAATQQAGIPSVNSMNGMAQQQQQQQQQQQHVASGILTVSSMNNPLHGSTGGGGGADGMLQ